MTNTPNPTPPSDFLGKIRRNYNPRPAGVKRPPPPPAPPPPPNERRAK